MHQQKEVVTNATSAQQEELIRQRCIYDARRSGGEKEMGVLTFEKLVKKKGGGG